jgi:hypothetical protein
VLTLVPRISSRLSSQTKLSDVRVNRNLINPVQTVKENWRTLNSRLFYYYPRPIFLVHPQGDTPFIRNFQTGALFTVVYCSNFLLRLNVVICVQIGLA